MITFTEFANMRDKALNIRYNEFIAVAQFNDENPIYIHDHFSGNWYSWKWEKERELSPNSSVCRLYLTAFNTGDFAVCKELFEKISEI